MKAGHFFTYCKGTRRFWFGPFFYIKPKHSKWFYKTPYWLRSIIYVFVCPESKPITRLDEKIWDYLAALHDRS